MKKHERKSLTRNTLIGILLMLALHLVIVPAAMAKMEDGASGIITITGTVVETDDGYVIVAESEDYLVVGIDLSDMLGKTVEAIGTVSDGDSSKQITVRSVEQIEL